MSQSCPLLGSHASPSSSSSSAPSDSEVGGVLLAEHSPPLAQLSEKAKEVAAWLSCVASPSPALKEVKKSIRFLDSKSQNRSPSPTKRSRAAPYAMSFPSSTGSKSATKLAQNSVAIACEPAAKSITSTSPADATATPLSHFDIIAELLDTPYEGVCPFITATACPQGQKCSLKFMKPSTVTSCPSHLKKANEPSCRNKVVQHRKSFCHQGDDRFEELKKLKELRDVHKKGEWGV